jgi:DNA-binding CsgD family transcriptional regulator
MPKPASAAVATGSLQTALSRRLQRAVAAAASGLSAEKQADLVSLGDDRQVLAALASLTLLETKGSTGDSPMARAIARGLDIKKRLLAEAGGALTSEQVADLLHVSRETVAKYRRSGRLLGLPKASGDYLFPLCQFHNERLLPGFEQALAAFHTDDPWHRLQVLLTPDPNLGMRTPLSALKAGDIDAVARAVAAYEQS